MKCKHLLIIAVAIMAAAAVAYVVIRHFDEVMRPVNMLLKRFGIQRKNECGCCEDEIFEIHAE